MSYYIVATIEYKLLDIITLNILVNNLEWLQEFLLKFEWWSKFFFLKKVNDRNLDPTFKNLTESCLRESTAKNAMSKFEVIATLLICSLIIFQICDQINLIRSILKWATSTSFCSPKIFGPLLLFNSSLKVFNDCKHVFITRTSCINKLWNQEFLPDWRCLTYWKHGWLNSDQW